MEIALAVIFIGLLVFLAHLFAGFFQATRIPDVFPLVAIGLILGPVLHLVPLELFGQVGGVFTTVALVVILFESGLNLRFATLRAAAVPGVLLTIFSFVGAVMIVTLLAVVFLRLAWLEGMVLGAILGGTSSVVVIPLIGRLRLQPGSRTTLLLESALSDVLCIVVTLGLVNGIRVDRLHPGEIGQQIGASFLLAAVIGAASALVWAIFLGRIRRLENSIFLTPAFVFIIFGLTELVGYSGAIAALVFGIVLGNVHARSWRLPFFRRAELPDEFNLNETERVLFAEGVFLLKTFFFVYLGLSIRLNAPELILVGLAVTVGLTLIRIPIVHLALDKATTRFDAAIASVMVPKGLAAAVLATVPQRSGIESGTVIQDVVYAVILFSIVVTAALAFAIEKGILRRPYAWAFRRFASEADALEPAAVT